MSALMEQLSGLLLALVFLAGLSSYFLFLKALPKPPEAPLKKPPLRRPASKEEPHENDDE